MPTPRLSHSAEAAKAAALQAEFNEKKWVWVPDDKEGYLSGWVTREEGDAAEVVLSSGEVCYACFCSYIEYIKSLNLGAMVATHSVVEDESTKI